MANFKTKTFYFKNKISLEYIEYENKKSSNCILFFHANGYSCQTYNKLLKIFYNDNFNVFGLNFSGHSKSENHRDFDNWYFFRDQVLEFIEFIKKEYDFYKFHLVGHSLGGASSLLASAKNTENIVSVSCWDPVVLTPFLSLFTFFVDPPLAKLAQNRRDTFNNLKVIQRSYRLSNSFKNWDEEVFNDYLQSCFYYDSETNTYKLCLPKEIEAKIFRSLKYGHWKYYKKIKQPVLIYTTKNSQVCPIRSCKLLTRNHTKSQYIIHPSGSHFFPMEDPINTAKQTLQFIKSIT